MDIPVLVGVGHFRHQIPGSVPGQLRQVHSAPPAPVRRHAVSLVLPVHLSVELDPGQPQPEVNASDVVPFVLAVRIVAVNPFPPVVRRKTVFIPTQHGNPGSPQGQPPGGSHIQPQPQKPRMVVILPAPPGRVLRPVPIQTAVKGMEIHLAQELQEAPGLDGFIQMGLESGKGLHPVPQQQMAAGSLSPGHGLPAQFPGPGPGPGLHIGFLQAGRAFVVLVPGRPAPDPQGHLMAQIPGRLHFPGHTAVPSLFVAFGPGKRSPFTGRPAVPVGESVPMEIPGAHLERAEPEPVPAGAAALESRHLRRHIRFQIRQIRRKVPGKRLLRRLFLRFQGPLGHLETTVGPGPVGQRRQVPHPRKFVNGLIIPAVHRHIGRHLSQRRPRPPSQAQPQSKQHSKSMFHSTKAPFFSKIIPVLGFV